MIGYLQLARTPRGKLLAAAMPESAVQAWTVDEESTPSAAIGRELVRYCSAADALLCPSVPDLTQWLSLPRVLREVKSMLGRLVDLREVALLVAADLHQFSLDEVCRAHNLQPPSPTDLDTFASRWDSLALRLRERGQAMRREARALVAAAAGPAWPEALLGSPEIEMGPSKAIASLLPRRPRRIRQSPIELRQRLEEVAAQALSPDGMVAATHPAYEHRPGQIEMARGVAAAFEREEFLLVEAGTGTGKSLAYLIPAIALARSQGVPVLVSTNTKNLQDQLVQRDIPLAGRALGIEFVAEVIKGRNNYVCPRLLASAIARAQESVFRDERLALAHLAAWVSSVSVADLDYLSPEAFQIAPALRSILHTVRARSETCTGRQCTYYQCCPAEVARARAQNADIVVVNHALLLAGAGTTALPEYAHLIIDEAHNLEDVATDQLGREVTDTAVRALLRLLSGDNEPPLNERMARWLETAETDEQETIAQACSLFPQVIANLEYALEDLATAVLTFVAHVGTADAQGDRRSVRLTETARERRHWQPVIEAWETLNSGIRGSTELLGIFRDVLGASEAGLDEVGVALEADIQQCIAQLDELRNSLSIIVEGQSERDFVCWASTWTGSRGEPAWELRAAPIDVGPALKEALYSGLTTLVMTSATLTVEGSFAYLRQRLGLDAESNRLLELTVPSPFDFPKQLLLCIPADLPLPGEPGFEEASWQAIYEAATTAQGGTLCLFTSRESMVRAFEELQGRLLSENLTPICQDLATSRTAALESLREDPRAVLFGLKSFWEGVDVPGEALRCLVIVKLPFPVPTDPIIEARQERVEQQGLNGYNDYYVPAAVIGFRQGIGRLIRTRSDYGVVFVLDRRILLRPYGRRFLTSVPACRAEHGSLRSCLDAARAMLHPRA